MEREEYSGIRKAAILLLTLDEDLSRQVIKDLDEDEIEMIGQEISKLDSVPKDLASKVHGEFLRRLEEKSKQILGGSTKFKDLLNKTFGEDKARTLWESAKIKEEKPSKFLKNCDSRILANVLKNEHPQTTSLVLSSLDMKKATEVVGYLPSKIQGDVLMRMASLERVDRKIIEEIEVVLKDQLESIGIVDGRRLGGIGLVATMLNQMDQTMESDILEKIEETNPELADRIKQLMFTFEDLIEIDDKSIQLLLKEISSEDLSLALKGASDALKEKIFKNMSERAAKMLREDLEAMGPVRVSDVERSQIKIAMITKKLGEEGKIPLSGANERFL
jgi:flagellar motor switch protein FliG